jgi:hypothetical protein
MQKKKQILAIATILDPPFKRRFHGGFTSVARSASLALEESFSFSWWLTTSRLPQERAYAIERASVELSHQLI